MADRSAKLVWSFATWMSWLFCSASSTARFRVSVTAPPRGCSSCERAGLPSTASKVMHSKLHRSLGVVRLFVRALFLSCMAGSSRFPVKVDGCGVAHVSFVSERLDGLQPRGLVRGQVAEEYARRTRYDKG